MARVGRAGHALGRQPLGHLPIEGRWGAADVRRAGNLGVAAPFRPVGTDLAFVCDRTGFGNVTIMGPNQMSSPHRWSNRSNTAFPHGDPANGASPGRPTARRIAFNRNEAGFGRLCVVDLASRVVRDVAKAHHGGLHWVGGRLVAVRTGGRTPPQIVSYNTETWERTTLVRGPVSGWETHRD